MCTTWSIIFTYAKFAPVFDANEFHKYSVAYTLFRIDTQLIFTGGRVSMVYHALVGFPLKICLFVIQGITLASAKAVAAGNSGKQVDVSACANLGRKAVSELLDTCKAAALGADNEADRTR